MPQKKGKKKRRDPKDKKEKLPQKKVLKTRVYFRVGCFFTDERLKVVMNKKRLTYNDIKPEDPLFHPNFQSHCIGNMPELPNLLQDEEILGKLQDEALGDILIEIGENVENAFKYLENKDIIWLIKRIEREIDKVSRETRGQQYLERDQRNRIERKIRENWPLVYLEEDETPPEPSGASAAAGPSGAQAQASAGSTGAGPSGAQAAPSAGPSGASGAGPSQAKPSTSGAGAGPSSS